MPRTCTIIVAAALFVLPAVAVAADLAGYLVDSSGTPVRSAAGTCIRSGSWSATLPGPGCDATPDRIVLLPGQNGEAGTLIIRTSAGEKVLDTPYGGVEVSPNAIVERREDAASVQARYGRALAAKPPRPLSFTVHFATGSSTELTAESRLVLDALKTSLAGRPVPEVTVIGHTDRIGSLEANDRLSVKRAETVRDILVTAGIKASSLEIAGRGEREPLVPTADEVAEQRNRRVEISVR